MLTMQGNSSMPFLFPPIMRGTTYVSTVAFAKMHRKCVNRANNLKYFCDLVHLIKTISDEWRENIECLKIDNSIHGNGRKCKCKTN